MKGIDIITIEEDDDVYKINNHHRHAATELVYTLAKIGGFVIIGEFTALFSRLRAREKEGIKMYLRHYQLMAYRDISIITHITH